MKKTPTRKDIEGALSFYGIKKTAVEMLEKDPNSDYIQGRMDMAKTILASCDRLTD